MQYIGLFDSGDERLQPAVAVDVLLDLALSMAAARLRAATGSSVSDVTLQDSRNYTGHGYKISLGSITGVGESCYAVVSQDANFVWQDEPPFECPRCGADSDDRQGLTECSGCENCENCCTCDMWYCEGCSGYVFDSELSCGNCEYCESCCNCVHCSACNENNGADEMCGDGCGNCESCCECLRCSNCGDVANSLCEEDYGTGCCCDSYCRHAQEDDSDDDD